MVHLDSCYESMEERTSNQKPDPEDMEIWNRDYDQISTYQSPLIGSLTTPEMLSYAGHQSSLMLPIPSPISYPFPFPCPPRTVPHPAQPNFNPRFGSHVPLCPP
jgi:hypothetical protein